MRQMLWMIGAVPLIETKGMLADNFLDFAKMSAGAYKHKPSIKSLFGFNTSAGLGARVYDYKGRIVVAFKGATPTFWGLSFGPSANNDRELANVLFSSCQTKKCKAEQREAIFQHSYFQDAGNLVNQVLELFQNREIVLTGHSLGGAIASVLTPLLNGPSAVVFSAPGELHLLSRQEASIASRKTIHLGICNDPIYRGQCFGMFSACGLLNYHISTGAHSGKAYCIDLGTASGIINHKISAVIRALKTNAQIIYMPNQPVINARLFYSECNKMGQSN